MTTMQVTAQRPIRPCPRLLAKAGKTLRTPFKCGDDKVTKLRQRRCSAVESPSFDEGATRLSDYSTIGDTLILEARPN
jgi:hypothetical protein